MPEFVGRIRCFACAELGRAVGLFRYHDDQAGFVPEPWLTSWCRAPALLYRCDACGSQWPRVVPSAPLLSSWYEAQQYAESDVITRGHDHVLAVLAREARGGTIVDVGCGAGAFLGALPLEWKSQSFGLEPSEACRAAGRSRGRRIVPPDDSGWSSDLPAKADVITLFDVIEHVTEPGGMLAALAARLAPAGRLIVFTGDAGSAWARRCGARWWYHGWAGHVSCFSTRGLVEALKAASGGDVQTRALPFSAPVFRPKDRLRRSARTLWQIAKLTDANAHFAFVPRADSDFGVDHVVAIAHRK